jgi:hypothetical protein
MTTKKKMSAALAYYHANKEKSNSPERKAYMKAWRKKNQQTIYLKRKERMAAEPLFKLRVNTNVTITTALKGGYTSRSKAFRLLCCSFEVFKCHLEAQFEPWMSWENRGLYNGEPEYGWDLDHIMPLVTAGDEAALLKLHHYTNIRPMCSYANRNKNRMPS